MSAQFQFQLQTIQFQLNPPFQAFEEVHSIPSSPARSVGFLSDLFEPIDSETLECKVDRALDNQKILLSLLSKIMGEVAQISRALRLGGECVLQDLGGDFSTGGENGRNVPQGLSASVGGDRSVDRVRDWKVNPVESQGRDFEPFDSSRNDTDQSIITCNKN